jgi:hypothetical protein
MSDIILINYRLRRFHEAHKGPNSLPFRLADPTGDPLHKPCRAREVYGGVTNLRDLRGPMTRVFGMSPRFDIRALNRGVSQARPAAALILGGLLLLTSP